MDMAVSRPYRSLDHLCFSPQMYFMCSVHAIGVLTIILGMEIVLHQRYVLFKDMVAPILFLTMLAMCHTLRLLCEEVADLFGIWTVDTVRVRVAAAAAADPDNRGVGKDDLVPRWDAAYRLLVERLRASKFLTPQRLTDDAFRARFIRHNREWLAAMIGGGPTIDPVTGRVVISPGLLTHKTLATSGARFATAGYFVRQLGRLLLADRNRSIEISSSSSSSDSPEKRKAKKSKHHANRFDDTRPLGVSPTVANAKAMLAELPFEAKSSIKTVAMLWLETARFRRELIRLAQPIIQRHMAAECRLCHTKPGGTSPITGAGTVLVVKSNPPIHSLVALYELAHWNKTSASAIDSVRWTKFVQTRATFTTLCMDCESVQNQLGMVLARQPQARSIAKVWLAAARAQRSGTVLEGTDEKELPRALEVSDDSTTSEDAGEEELSTNESPAVATAMIDTRTRSLVLQWLSAAKVAMRQHPSLLSPGSAPISFLPAEVSSASAGAEAPVPVPPISPVPHP
jgi:hypothetical protein